MTPPEQNPSPEQNIPDTSKAETPETSANTSQQENGRDLRSGALSADQAVRSGVDRMRPAAERVGQRLAPLLQRLLSVLAPLIERLKGSPAFQRLSEKVTAGGHHRRPSRLRAVQVGVAAAAVGVLGIVIGTAGGGEQNVDNAAHVAKYPSQNAPERAQGGPVPGNEGQGEPAPAEEPEAPAPAGPPASGIDVSNHNGSIDWNKVAASGQQFAFVLATDGMDFTSKSFETQFNGAKNAGLVAGAYHFGRPDESAVDQANRLLEVNKYTNDGKTLPPVLDLEVDSKGGDCYGLTSAQMHGWTQQFVDRIKEGTGEGPIIYASQSFWSQCMDDSKAFSNHPLWVANYEVEQPAIPGGWDTYDFWQYTEEGRVDGVDGDVDVNKFNGSAEQLRELVEK